MGVFNRFKNIFKRSQAADTATTIEVGGSSVLYVPMPNDGDAMNISTVYRCVELVSNKVASLPLLYQRLKNDVFVDDTTSNLHNLLRVQPNPYMTAFDFWKLLTAQVMLNGNAYVYPMRDPVTQEVIALFLINPLAVSHNTLNDTYTFNDHIAGVGGTFGEDEIIHIKNYTVDGKTGLSTISHARLTTCIANSAEKETLNRFANGGGVRGFITNDIDPSRPGWGKHADKELDALSENIESTFRSGHQIAAIHGSAKFQQAAMSSADMQFLESKKFNVVEICRWFGVSPALCYAEGSNYKTAELADIELLANTLGPFLTRIENEFLRKLVVSPALWNKRRFYFDKRLLYACDLASRANYQRQTIETGVYSINDWRAFENLPKVEGGDTVLVSANLKSLDQLLHPIAGPTQPNKQTDNTNEDGK